MVSFKINLLHALLSYSFAPLPPCVIPILCFHDHSVLSKYIVANEPEVGITTQVFAFTYGIYIVRVRTPP